MELVDALPDNAIVVDETLTAAPAVSALLDNDDPNGYYGLASGGLGFGMPGAVGVSLGQPGRPVVAIIGDGSAMYGIQAIWTAAHLRLPVTYVIVNNRSYRIIKERLQSLRKSDQFVAMDMSDPPIDFVDLARSMGMASRRVEKPTDIASALREAIASGKPNLVEVVVSTGYEKG